MTHSIYNRVATQYAGERSPTIGVTELQRIINRLGNELSILDLGCGTGVPIAKALIDQSAYYLGVDAAENMIRKFKDNVPGAEGRVADIAKLSYPKNHFDLAFAFGTIFHLNPDEQTQMFKLVAPSVKPGGVLAFTTGREAGEATGHVCGHALQHWSLGKTGYISLLEELGLRFKIDYVGEGENYFMEFEKAKA
jgi:SAM-dependent methyltransferase